MPICPSIPCLPSGFYEVVSGSVLAITVPETIEFISQHALVAVAVSGFFGLLIGWLAKRLSLEEASARTPLPITPGFQEMKWSHEKLVLSERQQVEKQARLDSFADSAVRFAGAEEQTVALRLFVLVERVREARQKMGSELSRMIAVRDRLDEIGAAAERGSEAVGVCRGMADSRIHRLYEAREALRRVGEEVLLIEEGLQSGTTNPSEAGSLRLDLVNLKGRILSLPQGWDSASDETERRIRELLATVDNEDLIPVREILLVDGSLTSSLAGASGTDLAGGVGSVVAALDRAVRAKVESAAPPKLLSGLPTSPPSGNPFVEEELDFGFPDPAFRDPVEFVTLPSRPGKGFHDLTSGNGNGDLIDLIVGEEEKCEAGETDDSERSLVLFCSNNVELWGKTVYRGSRCRARAIQEFPVWAKWISICRLDTGERVFAPVRTANLRSGQTADPFGFNGTNELFYGARHLGFFSESCPNEVETRFTYGGWGFGHRAHEIAPEVEQLQAAGWEGREIPGDTVFEISIHEELPALGKFDRLLESEVIGKR